MNSRYAVLVVAAAILTTAAVGGRAESDSPVEHEHLTGNLHQFRCYGNVAIIASIGEDGTLLVDSGYGASASAVRNAVEDLGGLPIRLIVNTHGDMDHVAGNAVLGDGGVVIGHPYTRHAMRTFFALPAVDAPGQPVVTVEGATTIHFNGERVRLLPLPGGHTAGDLVVHFTDHDVTCVGDMVLLGTFPNADPGRGGDARRLVENLKALRELVPAETTFVASHGGPFGAAELDDYIDMVEATIAAVADEISAGRSLTEILERNPLATWAEWEKPEVGLTFERWIREIYGSLTGEPVISICAPVTESLEAEGAEVAGATYRRLVRDEPERWQTDRIQLNMLGYQLLARERFDDAIAVFQLNVEAFPDHFDPYDSLGEAYMRAGRTEEAIANYEQSLKLNPDNRNAAKMLSELRDG